MKTYQEFITEAKVPKLKPAKVTKDTVDVAALIKELTSDLGDKASKELFGDDLVDYFGDAARSLGVRNFGRAFTSHYKVKTHAISLKEFTDAIKAFAKTY